ncbi:hypothetical protein DFH07DRAFT_439400 [Mycena maculata]|uniref:Protein-S-isoprenylcysteine O-methyltransferase n=1 Tax=Mycena maculata TaxID=230809 RepID=A0AAD7K8W8_9AGAR|nr:hypothetical protein DFH07DRAFT_439400 [Mycena maculata]
MFASVFQIFVLWSYAYAYSYAGTSPNPPAAQNEKDTFSTSVSLNFRERIMSKIGPLLKCCIWVESGAQILWIVGDKFPPTSHRIYILLGPSQNTSVTYMLGWAIIVTATLIRHQCYRALGPMFTFDLSIKKDHRLVQTGPYSLVRHPSYSAFILLNFGIMMTHCGLEGPYLLSAVSPNLKITYNAFIVGISAWTSYSFLGRAEIEDKALQERFGKEWNAWAHHVPKFVPNFWGSKRRQGKSDPLPKEFTQEWSP